MRRFSWASLALVLALAVSVGACGGSTETGTLASNQAQAKVEANQTLAQIETQDPKVKKQLDYAQQHALGCGMKVHGHLVKRQTEFLTCEGITQSEIDRGKPCLDKTVSNVSILSLRDKAKRDRQPRHLPRQLQRADAAWREEQPHEVRRQAGLGQSQAAP